MRKKIGDRITVEVNHRGADTICLSILDGWNDHCPVKDFRLSLEEAHDLRYALTRALLVAGGSQQPKDDV